MNQEQLRIFNENVKIDNHNIEVLENSTIANRNAIQFVFDYVQQADFWWMVVVFAIMLYVVLSNIRVNQLEERIQELEDAEDCRPELQPLLAKATKV
tara:strand:- start:693 stop:983 length:291 start_codon:yes stop_codon:yes gene_type:complete